MPPRSRIRISPRSSRVTGFVATHPPASGVAENAAQDDERLPCRSSRAACRLHLGAEVEDVVFGDVGRCLWGG
jgi:hypothetical protein